MKTIERMMFAVHRNNTITGEKYGAVYVAGSRSEAEKWLRREKFEQPHLREAEFEHEIVYEKWNWHE